MAKLIYACFFLCCAGWAQAASMWEVSNGSHTLYLGGTLHVLSPSDYPLPGVYDDVYQRSDIVVFETDIEALSSSEFTQQSMQTLTYSNEDSLREKISASTLTSLETHLRDRGLPVQRFMTFKPALIGITLSMIELHRMGFTSQGVDKYFYSLAQKEGKERQWFETPQEQLSFIAKMGEEDEDAFIRYTLEDLNKMSDFIDKLKQDWRSGDMASFYDRNMQEFIEEYPKVYDELLTRRNLNWIPQLKVMLSTPATELVLVGTLHIPGKTGLLTLLKEEGYSIRQLTGEQSMQSN